MAAYIDHFKPDGLPCTEYYSAYTQHVQSPITRTEFDSLVSDKGYVKSRPSSELRSDRRWRWKKI